MPKLSFEPHLLKIGTYLTYTYLPTYIYFDAKGEKKKKKRHTFSHIFFTKKDLFSTTTYKMQS